MRKTVTFCWLTALLLCILLSLTGCSFVPDSIGYEGDSYLKLVIDTAPGRLLSVDEYDVTSLHIEVTDPDYNSIKSITWVPGESPNEYEIPITEFGLYEIGVSHNSEINGEYHYLHEWDFFYIDSMFITVITIVPGAIGGIFIEDGDPVECGGTITVELSGYEEGNGHETMIGLFVQNADTSQMDQLLAIGGFEISGGGGNSVMSTIESHGAIDWCGVDGSYYDLYFWVDLNDSSQNAESPDDVYPDVGIDSMASQFPLTVYLDGDVTISFTGEDMVPVEAW